MLDRKHRRRTQGLPVFAGVQALGQHIHAAGTDAAQAVRRGVEHTALHHGNGPARHAGLVTVGALGRHGRGVRPADEVRLPLGADEQGLTKHAEPDDRAFCGDLVLDRPRIRHVRMAEVDRVALERCHHSAGHADQAFEAALGLRPGVSGAHLAERSGLDLVRVAGRSHQQAAAAVVGCGYQLKRRSLCPCVRPVDSPVGDVAPAWHCRAGDGNGIVLVQLHHVAGR